jgi:lipopolysaccharide transport system ATP-binding protein
VSTRRVVVDGVWKKFWRGERHTSLRDLVPALARGLVRRARGADLERQEFWALKDVSFEVHQGEAIGIIGPNGAGKSTSLKLLSRILRPTRGRCEIHGRLGALIEVSSGFHPDLTGRENVFLQGAIMGMRSAEVARKLDSIVDFSGVGPFLDTQVKRYSSGMQARLGFAVAAHLEPDVFLVDEVLSVGDMSFQSRCLERMQQQIKAGVTLVFVSHNLQAVASLCPRTLVFADGQVAFAGRTEEALDAYLKVSQNSGRWMEGASPSFVVRKAVLESPGSDLQALPPHAECVLTVLLECLHTEPCFNLSLQIERTRDLLYCYGSTTDEMGCGRLSCQAGQVVRVSFRLKAHFARGHYRMNLNARDPEAARFLMYTENIAGFAIHETQTYDGVVDIEPEATVHIGAGEPQQPAPAAAAPNRAALKVWPA